MTILNLPPSLHPTGLMINLILSVGKSSNLQILWGAWKLANRIKTLFLNSIMAALGFSTLQPTCPCGQVILLNCVKPQQGNFPEVEKSSTRSHALYAGLGHPALSFCPCSTLVLGEYTLSLPTCTAHLLPSQARACLYHSPQHNPFIEVMSWSFQKKRKQARVKVCSADFCFRPQNTITEWSKQTQRP